MFLYTMDKIPAAALVDVIASIASYAAICINNIRIDAAEHIRPPGKAAFAGVPPRSMLFERMPSTPSVTTAARTICRYVSVKCDIAWCARKICLLFLWYRPIATEKAYILGYFEPGYSSRKRTEKRGICPT